MRNCVQLIGRLGSDPEVRPTNNGGNRATMAIATSETYKKKSGEKVTDTQWHNLVAYGKVAEIAAKFLRKGGEIAIQGKLTHRKYEDKDGERQYFTEVVVKDLTLLSKKKLQA